MAEPSIYKLRIDIKLDVAAALRRGFGVTENMTMTVNVKDLRQSQRDLISKYLKNDNRLYYSNYGHRTEREVVLLEPTKKGLFEALEEREKEYERQKDRERQRNEAFEAARAAEEVKEEAFENLRRDSVFGKIARIFKRRPKV